MKCSFVGQMDEVVVSGLPTVLEVTIAQESNGAAGGPTLASSRSDTVDPGVKIDLRLFVRSEFQPIGATGVELDPPAAGAARQCQFILRPSQVGEGEVLVVATQGPSTLTSLTLRPRIVATRGGDDRVRAEAARVAEPEPPPELLPQLTVIQQREGGAFRFRYLLDLEGTPDGIITGETPNELGDVEAYVGGIYAEIERVWSDAERDYARFTEDLRTYGGRLFSQLFDERLQDALWRHRRKIKGIKVFSTEPFIPWELVHVKQPGQGLPRETRFLGQMGLVRWLMDRPGAPRQLRVRSGRARYVIPTYTGEGGFDDLPEAALEQSFLVEAFGAGRVEPEVGSVRELLKRGGFDLLHYSGHGVGDPNDIFGGRLILQGGRRDANTGEWVPNSLEPGFVYEHARLETNGARPIVVLNACQVGRQNQQLTGIGGFADAFIKRGAGAFVGTLWSVLDDSARTFTEELYRGLLKNEPISRACAEAREKARKADDATWLAYVVYADPFATLATS